MKVTLVQPRYFNIWEALGLAYIGAYAKRKHRGALEIDYYQGYFDTDETIIEGAKDSDVVAFSCTSPVFKHGLELARAIKQVNPRARTVFGGFHPSAVPQDCLDEEGVDQVVAGEGEEAFLEILDGRTDRLVMGRQFQAFDDIFPDRGLVKNGRAIDLCERQCGKRITSFMSNRVCPFRCTFCAERIVTGVFSRTTNPVRERDPAHLLDEIELVHETYRLDMFKFADATWNTSPEKVIAFCEEKMRRGFTLPFEVNVHCSFVTKEMLRAMKAAGCVQINAGCESGSQRILRDIKKGLSVERIVETFDLAREIGIERRAYFLIGMPNETADDIRLTEKLVERIQPDVFGITVLCPYPGSDLYDPATMKHYDWSTTDEYSNGYWATEHFSNAELKQWQRYLMDKFANNLAWHNKLLSEEGVLSAATACRP
ncbi:MAG TPA: radical SAM protein [Candidatus Elarobacter sp.]|nr:radical SAM protein [Dongiaceae bacterium]HZW52836.1 radical SAM protein [Candidatus Elarobacter sp.]